MSLLYLNINMMFRTRTVKVEIEKVIVPNCTIKFEYRGKGCRIAQLQVELELLECQSEVGHYLQVHIMGVYILE